MTTPSTNEQIAMMARNLEARAAEHRANLAQELADLREMVAQMAAAIANGSSPPMGIASRIRASGLDVERVAIELKAEQESLEFARRAQRALEGATATARG
jgi:hypothetical protein